MSATDHRHLASEIHGTPAALPELDRECINCYGRGIVTAPEWHDWREREIAAENAFKAANPGKSWYGSAEAGAIGEEEPDEPEMTCPKCNGSGQELTDAGRALLAFLQRHPPALTRVSTDND